MIGVAAPLLAGYLLARRHVEVIGQPPTDLPIERVEFPNASGTTVHGWFVPGRSGRGCIVLMHGIRATRRQMVNRARILHRAGYSVLLFDFQAHGETPGRMMSFGYLESRDAHAAVQFARNARPGEKVAAIGYSLGGAASLLGQTPLPVDALVLEAVYPTIQEAVENRLRMRGGALAATLAPVLTVQIGPRLGVPVSALRPIDRIGQVRCPLMVIGGSEDRYTTPAQTAALFAQASGPKELWIVDGGGHVGLDGFAAAEYERRLLGFLDQHL